MNSLTPYIVRTPKTTRLVKNGKIELPETWHGCIAVIKNGIRIFTNQPEGISRFKKEDAFKDALKLKKIFKKENHGPKTI